MSLPAPEMLVPHRGEALLLERIELVRADGLIASLTVRGQPPYGLSTGSLPTWAGPEIMAQAVSAFATIRSGQPYRPKPGLLLGLRAYRTEAHEFATGTHLSVNVRESTRDEAGWAVFDSTLSVDGKEFANGVLTVFQPVDVLEALAEQIA
jgi:predicted hotdog family 3-hydroxylacyl-ACP dehydratase